MSYTFLGASAYAYSGASLAPAGDVDGDGLDDILIGAPNAASKSGHSFLVLSSRLEALDLADGKNDQTIELSNLAGTGGGYAFTGSLPDGRAGFSISSVGDVDDDGRADLLIGGYSADAPGNDSGIVYLLRAAELLAADTAGGGPADHVIDLGHVVAAGGYQFHGGSAGDHAGFSVTALGDMDSDGKDDFVIGARWADDGASNAGVAYLIPGGALAALDPDANGTINLDDVGTLGGYLIAGNIANGYLGTAMTSLGDLDGDGKRELVITANEAGVGAARTGVTYVLLSDRLDEIDAADGGEDGRINLSGFAAGGYRIRGAFQGEKTGVSVSEVPDFDGDGVADLLIGAPEGNAGGALQSGRAYLLSGAQLDEMNLAGGGTGTINLALATAHGGYIFEGEAATGKAGNSVAGIGDFDGDGRGEILIGAPGVDGVRNNTGVAYLIRSSDLATLDLAGGAAADRVIALGDVGGAAGGYYLRGVELDASIGASVASAGDYDNDGLGDLLIGNTLEDNGGLDDAGRTFLISGKQLSSLPPGTIDLDDDVTICFVRGTRIMTDRGEVAVERIGAGDLIATLDNGFRPVRWIGRSTRRARGRMAPVRIAAGTLGNHSDLWVSPQHRMLLRRADGGEAFVAAVHLVDGRTVTRVAGGDVDYFHLMCDDHQVIFAEGAPSESFFPGPEAWKALTPGARAELRALFPELDPTAARRLEGGPGPGAVPGFGPLARPLLRRRDVQRPVG